jgi:predicted O-methyltransferase YrrM
MTTRLAFAAVALASILSASEDSIRAVLDRMAQAHETYLSVPAEDGRALRLLAEAAGATRIVEIGTSTGYSGLWFCLALQKNGGHLTTFEFDAGRAARAREHFRQAGVADLVTVVEGDAHQRLATLRGPIDIVFLDADKGGYLDYLNKLLPLLRPGGLILAHNPESAPAYFETVRTRPDLETILYREGAGLTVTLKKR